MTAFPGLTKDLWALPARGLTESKTRMGDRPIIQWTYLCPIDGCFAMAHSMVSAESALEQVAKHSCPAPPRRGVVPQGKSLLEKMWDESDDALDAYRADEDYLGMKGDLLQGYIQGIAECISFCAVPYFRIVEDVLRQMQRRWKMRQGTIPFEPTPSYRFNPPPAGTSYSATQRRVENAHLPTPTEVAAKPTAKKAARKIPMAVPIPRLFSSDEIKMIKDNLFSGTVSATDLAAMFDVSESRIKAVAGPVPGSEADTEVFLGELFGS